MPLVKTSAIVLKSRRWGDADRIVTCYTLRFGKIRAVARGARRMKSRLGGSIEPFVLCQMDLFEKPGDSLYRLSQVAMQESFLAFREDLTLMTAAARMVNLVAAVVAEGDPDPRMFEALEQGLRSLVASRDPGLTVLLFQIRVLGVTGFKPQTHHCASCGRNCPEAPAVFSFGGWVGLSCLCSPASHGVRSIIAGKRGLSAASASVDFTLVSRLNAVGQVRSEVETAIESYVTAVTGRHLPSNCFGTLPI